MIGVLDHLHLLKGVMSALERLVLGDAALLERIEHVLGHGHVRPHGVVLEDDADVAALDRHVDALFSAEQAGIAHPDLSSIRLVQPQKAADQRGLAAAGRPDQTEDLAVFHFEVEILEDDVLAVAEGDVLKYDLTHLKAS